MEDWKIFANYKISNFGNFKRIITKDIYKDIKGSISNRGYRYFQVQKGGKRINYFIHQLVCKLFIGDPQEKNVIDHIDRNKLNNKLSNLRYVTQKENCKNQDKYINEIEEIDKIKRHKLVCKKYNILNYDKIKENNKLYYQKNKTKILEKFKNNKIEVICNECNKPRIITKNTFNRNKRLGVNTCKKCSSKQNLLLIKKHTSLYGI